MRVVSFALLLVALGVLGACASEEVNSEPDAAPVTVTETVEAGDTEEPTTEEAAEPTTEEAPPEPELTAGQRNALESAESYLEFQAFSRQGLIDQLTSEYGDGYSKKDATFAVDALDVNWKQQAVKAAEEYLEFQSFSLQGLIEQLESEYGSQFTHAQAVYGAKKAYN